jgi:RHS repeat-associated protein
MPKRRRWIFVVLAALVMGGVIAPAADAAVPSNSVLPKISGTARDGLTLTSTTGTWAGSPTGYVRQWMRCDGAGANCAAIAGGTATTYVLTSADVTKKISVRVTASNASGSKQATSAVTAVVAATVPVNSALPVISGTAKSGQTLSSTTGTWNGTTPLSFTRQWLRCDGAGANCASIAGATGASYLLVAADVGKTIRVVVTAANGAGSVAATSAATAVVGVGPPVNVTPAAISGVVEEGRDLSVTRGTWSGTTPSAYAYQWWRCTPSGCGAIAGATGTLYTLVAADVGRTVTAKVTVSSAGGTQDSTAAQTTVVAKGKPFERGRPVLSGTARDGQTLTAAVGAWTGSAPIGYAWQWMRCSSSGAGCASIAGATSAPYVVRAADIAHSVRAQLTATNAAGTATSTTDATAAIVGTAPHNESTPTIGGADGEQLTAGRGTWTGTEPLQYSYQWRRCDAAGAQCADIAGAQQSTYDAAGADVGATLRVRVTATNVVGNASEISPSRLVAARAPVAQVTPSLNGAAQDGGVLTAVRGTWSGTQPVGFSYRWQRCSATGTDCAPVAGADQLAYGVAGADIGSTLRIAVSAANAAGSAQAVSAVSAVVTAAGWPLNTDVPVISGAAEEGRDLSVTRGTWSGTAPLTYAYQWRSCDPAGNCDDIAGATGTAYTLTGADLGQRVAATVTTGNALGEQSATTAQTALVTQGKPFARHQPLVSGVGREGQTLTATGDWTGSAPIGYAWEWLRCSSTGADCESIWDATGESYVVSGDDIGQSIRARISATNAAGSVTATSAERPIQSCTTVFTPTAGEWNVPENWSAGAVPSSSDDACLPGGRTARVSSDDRSVGTVQGGGTLLISGGRLAIGNAAGGVSTIGRLTMWLGTLDGTGDLIVTTDLSWTGGTMTGAGKTVLPATVGQANISGGTLDRTLVNRGRISSASWSGTGKAVLENEGTVTHDGEMLAAPVGATPQIHNSGVFRKTYSGLNVSTVDWQIDNSGLVETTNPTDEIYFSGGSVPGLAGGGSWSRARLTGGTFNLGQGTTLAGPLTVAGATVNVADVQGSGDLRVVNGTLNLTDPSTISHVRNLSVSGGALSGTGDVSVSGALNWTSGTMSGAGRTIVASGATGSIAGGTLDRTLVNRGSITASGEALLGTSAAVLENEGTFTHDIRINYGNGMNATPAGATPQIRNSGTFRKTTPGISTVEWQIDNSGSIETAQPTDEIYFSGGGVPGLAGGGSWSGARLTGGTFNLGHGTTLAGPLTVAGATVNTPDVQASAADMSITSGALNLTDAATTSRVRSLRMSGTGGTLGGAGDLDVSLGFQWSGGIMSGTGRTTVKSGVIGSITGGTLSRTLINRGSLTSSGSFSLLGTSLATLENYGTFTHNVEAYQSRGLEPALPGATPRVNNYGTFQKTANGYGYSNVGWQFNNYGAVRTDANAGELFFGGGSTPGVQASGSWSGAYVHAGTFTWGPGTQFTGTMTSAGATISVPDIQGDGHLRIWAGTLALTDTTTTSHIKDLTVENAGTLAGAGSLTVSNGFSWKGGSIATSGTTTLAQTVNGTITGGPQLSGRLTNKGRVTMSQGYVQGHPGALLSNEGILDLNAQDWSATLEAVEPERPAILWNRGLIRKTTGTGWTVVNWAFANQGIVQELTSGHLYFGGPEIGTGVGSDGSGPGGPGEYYGDSNAAIPGATHCAEADPVNCVTGDFYEEATDLDVPGRGRPLTATRTYNAGAAIAEAAGLKNASSTTRLGPGWTHAYASYLELLSGYVVLHGANGATATYKSGPNATFTAAARVKATLASGANSTYVLTYKNQSKDVFDSTGRLLRTLDRNGYATTLTYDANGRIDHVSDEAGRQLTYTYDPAGRIATISDPLGRHVAYEHDAGGDLVAVTDVAGEAWHYSYDAQHRIISMRDPRGHETSNVYDSEGRVTRQTDASGAITRFAYTSTSTTVTNARGSVTRYEISGGLTSRVVRGVGTPQESAVTMVRDASGNVTQRTDPDGQVTKVTYDSAGNATKTTDPLNRSSTMTYSAANDLLTLTDPESVTTTIAYDSAGNPTSVSRPLTGTSSTSTTTTAYDPGKAGDLVSMTDATGHVWHYTYDAYGNRTSVTDPEGGKTTIAHNAIGWPTSTVGPRGNAPGADPGDYRSTIAYNDRGQPIGQTDPVGAVTHTAFDANGNVTSVTEPGDKTTTTSYDELDRPSVITRPGGSELHFAYDAVGNRTSVKDGLDHETTFIYDALDRQRSQTDAKGRTTGYSYDRSSRQTALTDPAGRTTTLEYDLASQLQSIDYSDDETPQVGYDYDALGRRSQMTDGSGTSNYSRDSLGRLTSTTDGRGRQLRYAYDLAGRTTKISYPSDLVAATADGQTIADPSVKRTYDDAGRIVSITDWLGHQTTFAHDPAGNTTTQKYPNNTTATFTYDHADQLTQGTDSGPDSTPILDLPYDRKLNGQVHTSNQSGTQPARTETLTYDALDQLEQATSGSGAASKTFSYVHDLADRLTRINTPDVHTTLEYDASNQLVRTKDTATGAITETFDYDELGNRSSQDPAGPTGPATYGYDQANRLTHYRAPAADHNDADTQRTYGYDGDGLRADLLWDPTGGLPLTIGDATALYVTGPDGLPLTQLRFDGTQRYYHHDQLGSTRALTAANGTVVARSDYDPYGNPTTTPAASNPFGYAGQYTDHATGLIYMRARWYDPATGQFITSDPIGHASGETNLYRYAAGDPANLADPSGLLIEEDHGDYRDAAWDSLSDRAEEAVAFYAAITVDVCASWTARAGAWVGGILSSLATHANRDTTLMVLVGKGGRGGREPGPVGRQSRPIEIRPGTNSPAEIGGRPYSGHALDRMQGRGIPPSAVEDAIANGKSVAGRGGSTIHYSPENHISVVVGGNGRVVTVGYGRFTP